MPARAFVPARDQEFYLLRAHRQPLPENVAVLLLETLTQPGDLVIDPFAASDALVRAALARGRRLLAADSNPIVAWAARVQATLPTARDINGAFLRLGDTRKEGETLRGAVEKLYASQCAQCDGSVIVDRFLWRKVDPPTVRGENAILAEKVYTCPNCGARRDDVNETDRQRAHDAVPRGLSYHVLVQRLLADDPANTPHIKRLLGFYTPRNLSALATVTQKLDVEFREDAGRNVLAALMLHALDVGTSLYPSDEIFPQREIPTGFVEMNIWRALEAAARGLSERAPALRLAGTPAQVINSKTPAAYIGQGGARVLAESGANAKAALVLSSPARLDPRFWELSFLWTRWLLGKNAAVPLEPLLDEKRQRWSWYGDALTKSIADVAKLTRDDASFVVAFPSGSHAMIEALMLAASPVFALQDFAFRPARGASRSTEWGALRGDYFAVWKRADAPGSNLQANLLASKIRFHSLQAAREILEARGEPLAYSWLHHAALERLAKEGLLSEALGAKYREGDNAFQTLRHRMEEGFKEGYVEDLDHWQGDGRVLWTRRSGGEVRGTWSVEAGSSKTHAAWRGERETRDEEREERSEKRAAGSGEREIGTDLVTQVEMVTREILQDRRKVAAEVLEDAVLAELPGLLTPEIELVEICARAWADLVEGEWVWREFDPAVFRAEARRLVQELGEHLDYRVVQDDTRFDLIWRVEKIIPGSASGSVREERFHEDAYAFRICERLDVDELLAARAAPLHGLVVLPETRVGVARERLRREPRLVKRLERAGWDFVRVPMIIYLLREAHAARPEFQLAWGLDPSLGTGQEQMELL